MTPSDPTPDLPAGHENDPEAVGKICDYYWARLRECNANPACFPDKDLQEKVFSWTHEAVRLDPYSYSYLMGRCYAEGIGCDAWEGFRLARKYWEDAFDFGNPDAADAIADLYEHRLKALEEKEKETADDEFHITHCRREADSWRRLADRARRRAANK